MAVLTADGCANRCIIEQVAVNLLAHDVLCRHLGLGLLKYQDLFKPPADKIAGFDARVRAIGTGFDVLCQILHFGCCGLQLLLGLCQLQLGIVASAAFTCHKTQIRNT